MAIKISLLTIGFCLRALSPILLGGDDETLLNSLPNLLERSLNCLELNVENQRVPLFDACSLLRVRARPLLSQQSVRFANSSFGSIALYGFAVHFLADHKPDQWQTGSAFRLTFKNK